MPISHSIAFWSAVAKIQSASSSGPATNPSSALRELRRVGSGIKRRSRLGPAYWRAWTVPA